MRRTAGSARVSRLSVSCDYGLIKDFLKKKKQRVVLNGQFSSWADVDAGVPQGSILGPLLCLIYINGLTNGLSSRAKLFADDTSLFSVVFNVDATTKELNDDLAKVQDWALRWEVSFNPDISKQAQEVTFSRKLKKTPHPPLMFNSNQVNKGSSQKHLGIILDESLSFEEHLKAISVKTNKALYLLRKLQNLLPRAALITLYTSFIRS